MNFLFIKFMNFLYEFSIIPLTYNNIPVPYNNNP